MTQLIEQLNAIVGKAAVITDPQEVNDPLSDVIIALADDLKRLKARVERLDGELQQAARQQEPAGMLTVEKEERAQYRSEQSSRADYVSMGEGI